MTLYMAFLRGINVGGNHIVKMADLKRTLEEAGMQRVQTYIQSGNILFESDEAATELEGRFERLLESTFGFPMPTMIRGAEEMKNIMRRCPYSFAELTEGQSIHLSLMKRELSEEEIAAIPDIDTGRDEYIIDGREMYWFFNQSMLDSKLPRKLQKIGPATMRNWKTIVKMDELAKARS